MKFFVKKIARKLFSDFYTKQDHTLMLLGQLHCRHMASSPICNIHDAEFKVYSQNGEDGIIQYLISQIPIGHDIFIEFGVQDYTESNTRFLLKQNNWSGLVVDGSAEAVRFIQNDDIYWRFDLTAKEAFITKENINQLISEYTTEKDIGLLSVDIDGNDYWVWDSIDVVQPRIVVCEYNACFGDKLAVTIPYKEDFYRTNAHSSNLYYGASLKAMVMLAEKKGYIFAGCNRSGSNAFFVRNDVANNIKAVTLEEGFVGNKTRESRNEDGSLSYLRGKDRLKAIAKMELFDLETEKLFKIRDRINEF